MSIIAKVRREVTDEQKDVAASVAAVLLARGFDQADLEESIKAIAETLGDQKGRTQAERDKLVDIELCAADEINALEVEEQLIVMSAFYKDPVLFREAIESTLAIDLETEQPPLVDVVFS